MFCEEGESSLVERLLMGLAFFVAAAAGISDVRTRLIPNRLLMLAAAAAVILLVADTLSGSDGLALQHLTAGVLTGAALFAFSLLTGGGLGMGDVKLFAVIGLMTGGSILTILFASLLAAAAFALIMTALKKITLKARLPLGPFALAGLVVNAFLM